MKELIDTIEAMGFEQEGGLLVNLVEWHELKALIEKLPTPIPAAPGSR